MIDIHTHILPHIDDGAKDTATAREMLKMQSEQSVKTIVSTSHYYGRKHSPQRFLEKRSEAFARIKDALPQDMEVRLGAEVHFTGVNMPEADKLCLLAIEKTKYILMELPFTTKWSGGILHKLADFVYETGYTPIIAHVERYDEVLKKPSIVNDFVDMGCLIQVNAQSFMDKKTKGFAFALLRHGLVHCIGSDAHDMETRKPCLNEAKQAIETAGLGIEWDKIQENMQTILNGENVEVEYALPVKKFFGRYR
jgi:protein-tyrosine phosphatase